MGLQPLLVHLIFHPKSKSSRDMARHLHRQLNDDVVVPGLRVPTVFCPFDDNLRPTTGDRLNIAERSFVVPLADDELVVDGDWCRFVADTWQTCAASPEGQHRCVPMQLTKYAWPLEDRLKEVNFGRAFAVAEGDLRNRWVTQRVVIELCRFLQGWEQTDDQSDAPTKLFLSHAKADMGTDPKVAQKLIDYLTADKPVDAWVDSGDIETGSKFSDAIRDNVPRTSLLAILTDNYSSREWCREEIMLAKEHQRPIAVIDSLMTHEVRSFPFLDNVPRMRWNGSAEAGVDLLLKETLRHLHTGLVLESSKRDGDIVFLRPPEPVTLLGVVPGSNILYPDPPLGVGELQRLSKSQVTFSTPLERSAESRPLAGKLIALSMSESSDVEEMGMDDLHSTQTMLEISRHLLLRGASLAYGGHLGEEGYTQRLFELVRTHNNLDGVENFERLVNHRGWPFPRLTTPQLAEWKSVSTIVAIPRPADIDESLSPEFVAEPGQRIAGDASPENRYAWCRGMTEMRSFQADKTQSNVVARIVVGGTFQQTLKAVEGAPPITKWYSSRMPGVLEEILLSIKSGQPVFLIGAFGGVARLAADLMQGKSHRAASWNVQSQAPYATETRDLFATRNQKWWYYDDEPRIEGLPTDDHRSIVKFLAETWQNGSDRGWETGLNPLTRELNQRLFETVDSAEMVELLHLGLMQC